MIDNLLFSINVALPIFLVMLIGWVLRQREFINETYVQRTNALVFYVALPIKLFYDVSRTNFFDAFDMGLMAFIVGATAASMLLAWLIGAFTVQPAQLGAFVQGCFRGNFLYIGFSLMENITGSINPKAPIAAAFVIPLYNLLSVFILTDRGGEETFLGKIRKTGLGIIRNPLTIAIALGALVSLVDLRLPVVVARTMDYFSVMTTPLALLAIGASFQIPAARANMKTALLASGFKLVLLPLVTVSLVLMQGVTGNDLVMVFIFFGGPTATVSYIMAANMKGDSQLAASIIMLTTALSVLTMTGFVFAFKTLGLL